MATTFKVTSLCPFIRGGGKLGRRVLALGQMPPFAALLAPLRWGGTGGMSTGDIIRGWRAPGVGINLPSILQ